MLKKMKLVLSGLRHGQLKELRRQVRWIGQYARHHVGAMVLYTLLGLSGTLITLGGSYVSKNLVDVVTGHKDGQLAITFAIMIGMTLGGTFFSMISNYVSTKISMQVDAEIKADVFAKILVTDWESLTEYHTGDLLTRWSTDASTIASGVLNFIPNLIIDLFRFISALAMVLYYDATFAGISLVSIPFSLYISRGLMKRMRKTNMSAAAMNAKVSGFNQETFSNIQTIKAFDMISLYVERLKQLQKEYINMRLTFQRMSIVVSILTTILGMAVSYAAYGWGIFRVWSGAITYGTMTMFLSLSGTLTTAVNNMTSLIPSAIGLTIAARRLMDILEMPREDFSKRDELREFGEKHEKDGVSFVVEDVTYAYSNGNEVFDGAGLEAHPHEVVALVGPSGEGKTTMLRVLLSLVLPKRGNIYLEAGGERVPMTPSARQLVSYVPQGNTMFSGTIAQNMRNVKPDATDEEIIEALKIACAWDFVEKLPDGIESEIKERGGGFSEGQAQRLSISRAILRKSPILLLDEATSALDPATEKKLLQNIMKDEYPRTCILTTHRPKVLASCSRVYNIHNKKCTRLTEEEVRAML